MLKLTKKEEIKIQRVESSYILESEIEQKFLKAFRKAQSLNLTQIEDYIYNRPSISASLLAQVLQKLFDQLNESNINSYLAQAFKLLSIPHDQRQLRYNLKHKYRINSQLALLALWQHKNEEKVLYFVNLIIDCYTASLILNGKQILTLWQNYIQKQVAYLKSQQEVFSMTAKKPEVKGKISKDAFRKVVIPL